MSERAAEWQAFEDHAGKWEQYTRTPLGRLRQELVLYHLLDHLSARPLGLGVLDAGSGSGGYALALAQKGHRVWLVDFSQAMLDIARQSFREAAPDALARAEFYVWPIEELPVHLAGQSYDVVMCHTLLEYVPQPLQVLRALAGMVRPGGTLSLLLANPDAEALHWALTKRDLDHARRALSSSVGQADLFGLPRRSLPLDLVRSALRQAGLVPAAEYGVRIFADYLSADELADDAFYARLWSLEVEASQIEPYKRIARYAHIIASKE
jgi:2-polyprenyl-3-methyl-5-hydroxy-6-metoxy-1,4-benzoquinol methylase